MKRVKKLFRCLGLQAIYPHKRRCFSSPGHKLYPCSYKYLTVSGARQSLSIYFYFYNIERLRQGLGYRTPSEVCFGASHQDEKDLSIC